MVLVDATEEFQSTRKLRFVAILDRVERSYLLVLRTTMLFLATALVIYAAWLAVSGLYRIARSPDSVVDKTASVAAGELVAAATPPSTNEAESKAKTTEEQQRYYRDAVLRYYQLFARKFEPFRQPEDKKLSRDEFDDAFVRSPDRLDSIAAGQISFNMDRTDLDGLIATMNSAADLADVKRRLQAYRSARKVRTVRKVQKSRIEVRRGWNSLSTACESWYYSPIGCAETRTVRVPYTTTQVVMAFPSGTQSHADLFRQMQDRYFALLTQRRQENGAAAESERQAIRDGNVAGSMALDRSLYAGAAFLALMFFFLLIAMERHQRRLAQALRGSDHMRQDG